MCADSMRKQSLRPTLMSHRLSAQPLSRRAFLGGTAARRGLRALAPQALPGGAARVESSRGVTVHDLPTGAAPRPLELSHFPDRLHGFVWRNWELVPCARLAAVLQAGTRAIRRLAARMGLPPQPHISADQ